MSIITAATIIMVLVSSSYAYSALRHQQASSEFQATQKSIQTFDDVVRDVAWNTASTRAVHFTAQFGFLEVVGNTTLTASVRNTAISFSNQTAYLRYNMSTTYLTFGDNYQDYFIGDNKSVINDPTQEAGQALISQQGSWLNIQLGYRVRVLVEPSTTGCSYVDVFITRLDYDTLTTHAGDFDLLAKNTGIYTTTFPAINSPPTTCYIDVNLNGDQGSVPVTLPQGTSVAVFNFIVSNVQVKF
jgi:hypothetical protein